MLMLVFDITPAVPSQNKIEISGAIKNIGYYCWKNSVSYFSFYLNDSTRSLLKLVDGGVFLFLFLFFFFFSLFGFYDQHFTKSENGSKGLFHFLIF